MAPAFIYGRQPSPHLKTPGAIHPDLPTVEAHLRTLTTILDAPPSISELNRHAPALQSAIAGLCSIADSRLVGAPPSTVLAARWALIEAHQWSKATGTLLKGGPLWGLCRTQDSLEADVHAALVNAFKLQVGHIEQLKQRKLPPNSQDYLPSLTALNRLGQQADKLSAGAATFQTFAAANTLGKAIAREVAWLGQQLPEAPLGYRYFDKTADDYASLTVPLAGKTLPNLAYATHMSKSPGYMQDPAGTKVVTTTGSKRYLFEKSMLERTGQTGKIYKVRYADALSGGDNVRLIAKVQRTQNKVKNRQRTENKPLPVILAHSEHAAAAEAKIAQTLSPTHSTDADHLEYAAARVQVLDHFVDQVGKYYQIMPAKAGDLSDLTRLLSQKVADAPGVKPLVIKARRNVAYQSFRQLAALHQRSWSTLGGVAHRDLKLNNILFDLDGKVMLIDFDEAKQMTWRGSDGDPLENKGSIASPERHLSSLRDGTKGTGKPTDVWALAVSMLAFGAEAHANNPFNNPLCETSVGAVTQEAYFLTYAAYYAMGIDGKKGPHWAAAPTPDQEKALVTSVRQALAALSAETGRTVAVSYSSKTDGDKAIAAIAQAFSSYIRQQSDMDKELLTLLLEGGLHPHPHRRMSSAKIAQMLQEHENKLTSAERNELSVLFREVGSHTTLGP